MSIRSDIAEAVKDELAAAAGMLGITQAVIARTRVPLYDLADLGVIHLTVVGRSFEQERASRADVQTDVEIDIAVQKKVPSDQPSEIDPLADLVEAVIALFQDLELAGCPDAVWIRTANPVMYIPEHLDEKRLFTSVITLSYRVVSA
ncbi:MAG TPA: hypothetical protein VMY35_02735 [Phycisphaerae bacterium]|nr:hypothetical protein [Phycisphaerae bacterium]